MVKPLGPAGDETDGFELMTEPLRCRAPSPPQEDDGRRGPLLGRCPWHQQAARPTASTTAISRTSPGRPRGPDQLGIGQAVTTRDDARD